MSVLVINSGSSSIKYKVIDMGDSSLLSSGLLERIGGAGSSLRYRRRGAGGGMEESVHEAPVPHHEAGFRLIMETAGIGGREGVRAIGHRVVHGGETFRAPALIDDRVIAEIRRCIPLAPLHNPANLAGIEAARRLWPTVPQVAVFDTAFHQAMPPRASRYAVPERLYREHRVRRYGFHGTSHSYVARQAARHLGGPPGVLRLVTLHLGNGASAAAVLGGASIDTSMGMTPLEGLVMGTRCGDLDPALHFFLARETGASLDDLERLLNRESGLKGLCGTSDMREVTARAGAGDEAAELAVDMFCYRVRKYIGAYAAALGGLDAVVFTGGIGENSPDVRRLCCERLGFLGIGVDDGKNLRAAGDLVEIQSEGSPVRVLMIRTNEELEIARQTVETLEGGRRPGDS